MYENMPEYDPQSNGNAEVGVKLVKGMVRTMRSGFERELGFRVPVRHPLIAWLFRHAANTLTGKLLIQVSPSGRARKVLISE